MNIANFLTLGRLVVSPIFIFVYVHHEQLSISYERLPFVLLALFAVSETSDLVDGYIARKYSQVTDFGKIVDPMADSVFRSSMFLAFTQGSVQLPVFFVFILFYRDSIIASLRTICAMQGKVLAARFSGKLKSLILALCSLSIIILMILHSTQHIDLDNLQIMSRYIVSFGCFYVVLSGLEYLYVNRENIVHSIQNI